MSINRVRVPRALIVAFAVTAASLGGWVAVSAGDNPTANPGAPSASAAPAPGGVRAALAGGQSETYSGINPCRVLDTRPGSPLADSSRSFKVSGTLSGQGGLNNCGIPTNATSIAINLTGISTGSTGFVRGWAFGSTPATATLLNFGTGLNASNQVNIPLCRGVSCSSAFTLRAWGSADIVGDAVGYYTAPMYVAVEPSGTVYGGIKSGVVATSRLGVGRYLVTFDRNVATCGVTASDIIFDSTRDVSPDVTFNSSAVVQIRVTDKADALVDTFFTVTANC